MIGLIHQAYLLLDKQISTREFQFISEGGYREQ